MLGIHVRLELEDIGAERHFDRIDGQLAAVVAIGQSRTGTGRKAHKRVEERLDPEIRERGREKYRRHPAV